MLTREDIVKLILERRINRWVYEHMCARLPDESARAFVRVSLGYVPDEEKIISGHIDLIKAHDYDPYILIRMEEEHGYTDSELSTMCAVAMGMTVTSCNGSDADD